MNRLKRNAMLSVLALMFFSMTLAQSNRNPAFLSAKHDIRHQYLLDQAHCATLNGHIKKLCKVRAIGALYTAVATLKEAYQPSKVAHYHTHLIQAQAHYALAKQQCHGYRDKTGCLISAKAENRAAIAQARWVLSKAKAHYAASKHKHYPQKSAATRYIEVYY